MGNKDWERAFQMLQQQIAAANQPNPWEQQLGAERAALKGWLDKKDYRNLPAGVNIPMLDLAESQKMRRLMSGADTGQAALGANTNDLRRSQDKLLDDQFTKEWAGSYENAVGGLMDRSDSLGQLLAGSANQRSQNNVSNYAMLLQALGNKPKSGGGFWSGLFKGALSFI